MPRRRIRPPARIDEGARRQSLYGEQLVTNLAELLPKLCVVDLRCSRVDDTDVAAAIMSFDSREGACPVPVRAVAESAYRVRLENPRQFRPEYVDVRDFQGDVNRADIARVRVEPPRVSGRSAQDRRNHIRRQIFLASSGAVVDPGPPAAASVGVLKAAPPGQRQEAKTDELGRKRFGIMFLDVTKFPAGLEVR